MSSTGKENFKRPSRKPFWCAGLITLLVKFSVLFALSFSSSVFARETFEFDLGQKINVLSDKAFRKSSTNEFEAVGNVVITHLKNSIYGEKARINFTTGETEVIGNVRYIAPEMTLYGTKLKYNFLTKIIDLDNARVLSDNYVVTGKKIIQTSSDKIYAEEAEYTTCRDCPESWSIFGKQITITIGQYVTLKHAFIKVNGVTAMYVPYIVFPIKQKRETGLLFPSIGFSSDEGFRYQQPFFWAIDDYKDLTLTPSTFGDRGLGGELQYRQNIKEKSWFELNTLGINDRIYEPNKVDKSLSGKKEFRQFSDLEGHYIYKHYLNGHVYFNDTSDLDTIRDMDFFAKERVRGTEVGGGGFLEGRNSLFSLSMQSYYNKNMLISDPKKFDKQYVQMLPKLTLSSVPYNILHSPYPFLKNVSFGFGADYTVFKQNTVDINGPIRNARRLNFAPYLDWQLGNLGPVFFSHHLKLDYQTYHLPTEQNKSFAKKGLIYETEAKVELEKIYGLSYIEERPINLNSEEAARANNAKNVTTIGVLPEVKSGNSEQTTLVYNNSYRHSQEFKLKHYYLGEQKFSGNKNFRNQIESDDGQFDYLDALRDREHLTNQTTAQDSLPLSNTLEFQWNNNLIRKTSNKFDPYKDNRYLKDNFNYSNITFFDVSQGIDMTVDSERPWGDRLTRLYINTGIALDRFTLGVQEFYFHKSGEHKLTSTIGFNFDRLKLNGDFTYNSFNSSSTPITKLVGYDLELNLNDLITLKNELDYNIESKLISQSSYSILYAPINNCWKLEFNYTRDLIDKKFGLLLYINYNSNNFTSINVR
ncbi:LPS-assembly protein LptD [Bacteriovorax stolpii]|uniref:LPS-assembly protein LptD n=1 Tax=Bacteriovorax stolpii TaxID=960 RepID=UPI0010608753|nr:LPS-assembly protein LptD [Bacteriovorax stolpii]